MKIKELKEKIDTGEISDEDMQIMIDNDETIFYLSGKEIEVQAGGHDDVFELYKILFPFAQVDKV